MSTRLALVLILLVCTASSTEAQETGGPFPEIDASNVFWINDPEVQPAQQLTGILSGGRFRANPSSQRTTRNAQNRSRTRNQSTIAANTGAGLTLAFLYAPPVFSDFHEGSNQTVVIRNVVRTQIHVPGTLTSGIAGAANATYSFNGNDFFTTGTGSAISPGDGTADTFAMTEPIPPSGVPTNPGPGFVFDGGTVTYTQTNATTQAVDGTPADGELWLADYSFSEQIGSPIPGVGGVAVRRVKLAENNSPVPRDRFFVDYRFFNDVTSGLGDVNRYTVGLEKTCHQGAASFEVRIPFAATLDGIQFQAEGSARDFELGNITFIFKETLFANDTTLWSGGVGVAIPTGSDTHLFLANGDRVLQIDNEAVHILPFLAVLWTPNDNYWLQGFFQLDFAANGNPVYGNAAGASNGLPLIGDLNDSNWSFVDVSGGRWIYQGDGVIQRAGAFAELHYNWTLNDADLVEGNGITVTDFANRLDVVNASAGLHTIFNNGWTATAGITVPLREGDDRQMDYEIAILLNGVLSTGNYWS